MLRKYAILLDPDANDGGNSSPLPDANQGSTASTPRQQDGDSSPSSNDAKKDFAELAIDAVTKKSDDSSASTPAPKDEQTSTAPSKGDVSNSNQTANTEAQKVEKETKGAEDFSDLPFHKHERFQEIVKQRKDAQDSLAAAQPYLQKAKVIDDFMAANGITPQQFKDIMEIQALLNSNPMEAKKRLQPVLEYLGKFEGMELPQDLQAEVDAGTLSLERARQIVSLTTQKSFVEERSQRTAQQQRNDSLFNTMNMWEGQVMKNDPDYPRKQRAVVDRFMALGAMQCTTAEQAVALANQAYQEVNNWLGAWVPKPAPTKNLSTNGASTAVDDEPKNWNEVENHLVKKFSVGRR